MFPLVFRRIVILVFSGFEAMGIIFDFDFSHPYQSYLPFGCSQGLSPMAGERLDSQQIRKFLRPLRLKP